MSKGKLLKWTLGLGALAGIMTAYDVASKNTNIGDRKDATLIRSTDPMHYVMPNIIPNRADNEAYIFERIDISALKAFVEKKNSEDPEFRYTVFHMLVVAVLKTITLRPKLNRFISGGNFYMRNEVSASFAVKKEFSDESEETLAFVHALPSDDLDTIHDKIYDTISTARSEEGDSTSEVMGVLNVIPRFVSKSFIRCMRLLDRFGLVPASIIETDPYQATVMLANLGSVGLKTGYHHLANYGSNSIFVIMGKIGMTPSYDEKGKVTMVETMDLGLTVDERIADGYYFSRSINLLKKLLEQPELLEKRLDEEIDY